MEMMMEVRYEGGWVMGVEGYQGWDARKGGGLCHKGSGEDIDGGP